MISKEYVLQRIKDKMGRYDKDYYDRVLPRLNGFDIVQLVAFAIDHDIISAGSLYN